MKKYLLVFVIIGLNACQKQPNSTTLSPPWEPDYKLDRSENTIIDYEKKDAEKMPATGGIVFTGSSSFTKWLTAAEDLAPLPIINRGFGGSTLPEVIYYADRTILKYNPKTVVIYCENDMFGSKKKTPEQVRDAYVQLCKLIREKQPDVRLYCISLKPSPSRWARKDETIRANQLIQEYIKKDKKHGYIDVWPVMIKDGRPDGSIFVNDSLHMNQEGYRRWAQVLKPVLEKTA
ncbi:GDSL-type esterase/lipase family protein [Dyadobacter arcticus]|uniref:Lysophospholipase L1-like esterase n=1 Tax=Dyadobacter arcticus TaxID=1078754 RepID=A0ABX0UL69_9BACT|nr:GDSL-type esterase/lipase family protein [Dyadobacter arcticus]NIJ51861.1 lysophospholipase L1-like esterase [Dyadobacter arcticus]